MRRTVTCWYRLVDDDIEFNHLADGYDEALRAPVPRTEYQRLSWSKQAWEGYKATLVNGVVMDEGQ